MKEFVKKMLAVQTALKAPKNQFNKFGNYAYRNAEDIMEAVKPLLEKHGLMQKVSDEVVNIGGWNYVKATVTVTDGESSSTTTAYARETEELKGMVAAQITGSSSSYARKYALNGMYNIDDTKDADALNTHGKDIKEEKQQTKSEATKTDDKPTFRRPKPEETQNKTTVQDDL